MYFDPGIIFVLIILAVLVFASFAGSDRDPGLDRSMDWHRRNGDYRVQYLDTIDPRTGKFAVSQPFTYEVALSYAHMFNGRVISR
jgi:hypothetical protein